MSALERKRLLSRNGYSSSSSAFIAPTIIPSIPINSVSQVEDYGGYHQEMDYLVDILEDLPFVCLVEDDEEHNLDHGHDFGGRDSPESIGDNFSTCIDIGDERNDEDQATNDVNGEEEDKSEKVLLCPTQDYVPVHITSMKIEVISHTT